MSIHLIPRMGYPMFSHLLVYLCFVGTFDIPIGCWSLYCAHCILLDQNVFIVVHIIFKFTLLLAGHKTNLIIFRIRSISANPLLDAVLHGNTKHVQSLLESGVKVRYMRKEQHEPNVREK